MRAASALERLDRRSNGSSSDGRRSPRRSQRDRPRRRAALAALGCVVGVVVIVLALAHASEPAPPPLGAMCPGNAPPPMDGAKPRRISRVHAPGTKPRAWIESSVAEIGRKRFRSCHGEVPFRADGPDRLVHASPASYARVVDAVRWREGETLRYGVTVFLAVGFHAGLGGQVALLRWDNYPSRRAEADFGGVVIYGSDRLARLVRGSQDIAPQVALTPPFEIPEGRWVRLDVLQRLGDDRSRAFNEVYLDGTLVSRSHKVNTYSGEEVERVRFGLVALAPSQLSPLTLWFHEPTVERLG
jgi:hypothetical protein